MSAGSAHIPVTRPHGSPDKRYGVTSNFANSARIPSVDRQAVNKEPHAIVGTSVACALTASAAERCDLLPKLRTLYKHARPRTQPGVHP